MATSQRQKVKTDNGKVAGGGIKVRPHDLVEVKWKEGSKFHKPGSTSQIHPVQAERFEKLGKVEILNDGDLVRESETGKEQTVGIPESVEDAV